MRDDKLLQDVCALLFAYREEGANLEGYGQKIIGLVTDSLLPNERLHELDPALTRKLDERMRQVGIKNLTFSGGGRQGGKTVAIKEQLGALAYGTESGLPEDSEYGWDLKRK